MTGTIPVQTSVNVSSSSIVWEKDTKCYDRSEKAQYREMEQYARAEVMDTSSRSHLN